MTAEHSRTHSWADPADISEARKGLSGLEFMERLHSGEIPYPPSGGTLDFRIAALARGSVTIEAEPGEYQYNAVGSVHGGVLSAWLDSAMGYSIQSTLEVGEGFTTLDLTVRFIRGVSVDTGPVRAVGKVEHRGGRTATARGELRDSDGALLASGTTTGMILR
ncbi:PaaI family thioesterase [Tomitella fengzijianii]|uniref:PaaI family thioesterase n=1 Tax=Tomitella fengzijianii TaxID=2597660 RepID=A0A516X180_9ACTN|nr:PaaI family thioesterase [Tomitella fengzijianii]QDQ96361.1 PaaI family thioesterase [Tomitella fengzijianii]